MKHIVMIGIFFTFLVSTAYCAEIVPDFRFFCDTSLLGHTVQTDLSNDLKYRDPDTGVDSLVQGMWHVGFINYLNPGAQVVGYADTFSPVDYPGYLFGIYFESIGEGQRPDDIIIVFDENEDGIGKFESGSWYLGGDDVLFNSQDILFGTDQIRGDVSQLPPFIIAYGGHYGVLPEMIIDPFTGIPTLCSWTGDAGVQASWHDGANWDAGLPQLQSEAIIDNGGITVIDADISVRNLSIGDGNSGSAVQNGGENTITENLELAKQSGASGQYEITDGTLNVNGKIEGGEGDSTLVINGGQVNADDISVSTLKIGEASGSIAHHIVETGDSVAVDNLLVGVDGAGTIEQTGGQVIVATDLQLGQNTGSSGTYELKDGALQVNGNISRGEGYSTLILDGGTLALGGDTIEADNLIVANDSSVDVTYGTAGGTTNTNIFTVAKAGTGTYVQQDGSVSVSDTLKIGAEQNSSGTYEMQGGVLTTNSVSVGYDGSGKFLHSGGNHNVTNWVVVGYKGNGDGIYELGGNANLTADKIYLGIEGSGKFIQDGGSCTALELRIGNHYSASGTYELSGGSLETSGTYIGGYDASTGNFLHSGGSHKAKLVLLGGFNSAASGTYELSFNGQLTTDNMGVGYEGTGTFIQSGGELYVGNLFIYENGNFAITDAAANIIVTQEINFGDGASLQAVPGSAIHMTGSTFDNQSTNGEDLADLINLTFIFEGGDDMIDPFEIAGEDMGADIAGFDSNFALGTLQLGGDEFIGQLQLVDLFDNQTDWQGSEALYVTNLVLGQGSMLDLNGFNLYYENFSDLGGTINLNGGSLVQVPEPATIFLLSLGGLLIRKRK